ncbi:MAG: porin [Chitinophagaceae bacterium]|nr:porin [Chitinophagaceae bacterium]
MKYTLLLGILLLSLKIFSQNNHLKKFSFGAYAELYYSYDFSSPQNHEKSNFLYNHKRHNEVNFNLLLLKANYTDKNFRANLGLMAGNYAQYNLATEPTWAQFIYEATIGMSISKKQNLWLEAGVMPSHIGFESAISADCWTLTRSLLAENSPYYETGIKLGYTSKKEHIIINIFYLNGWQKIVKPNNIQKPSFGTQVIYKPSNNILLNYSTFLGTDNADSMHAFRQLHNLYLQYDATSKFGITAGLDVGMDKFNATHYGIWYSPVLIIRQRINKKTSLAFRGEYYSDPKQIIISTGTNNGFQTFGFSSNLDVALHGNIKFRLEGKMYQSKDVIFSNKKNNYALTTNLTLKL